MTFAFQFRDLCIEFFLLIADRTGGDDLHPDKEITGFSAPLDSFPVYLQGSVVLDSCRYLKIDMALVDGLDVDRGSQDGLCR